MDVLVVGAGVIGLTTAITLADAGHEVRVRASDLPATTTSATAGALWGPWLVEPYDRAEQWAAHTLRLLTELATMPGTGVRLASGSDVSMIRHEPPAWFGLLADLRPCSADELPPGYRHGVHYTAPLVDMPSYLGYLVERLATSGVEIEGGEVGSLAEASSQVPVVINCAGLGARELAGDDELFPIRGQQLVVRNPGLTDFLEIDTGESPDLIAVYPHGGHVVLSGTAEPGSWSREADPATAEAILARCVAVQPQLAHAEVLEHRVGLRPTRLAVRLAEEDTGTGRIIHNYGHGGAGVSLAWGCAQAVIAMLS